jgi:hypothetical protein
MAIASYQKKVFNVSNNSRYTFDSLEWSGTLETEAQDKIKQKPSTYIKGEGLGSMSFDIPLRIGAKLDVRAEIEAWEAIKAKGAADYFILGTKPLGKTKWLLKSVTVSDTEIDGKGRLLKASLKLSFDEYVRAGKASSSGNSSTGSPAAFAAPAAPASPAAVPTVGGTKINLEPLSYIDKPKDTRKNPNAQAAVKAILLAKPYQE